MKVFKVKDYVARITGSKKFALGRVAQVHGEMIRLEGHDSFSCSSNWVSAADCMDKLISSSLNPSVPLSVCFTSEGLTERELEFVNHSAEVSKLITSHALPVTGFAYKLKYDISAEIKKCQYGKFISNYGLLDDAGIFEFSVGDIRNMVMVRFDRFDLSDRIFVGCGAATEPQKPKGNGWPAFLEGDAKADLIVKQINEWSDSVIRNGDHNVGECKSITTPHQLPKNPTGTEAKAPHKHAGLIKAWADGAKIEVKVKGFSGLDIYEWAVAINPEWSGDSQYRIKPHKHADLISAYKNGALIQLLKSDDTWMDLINPDWSCFLHYRIKPVVDHEKVNRLIDLRANTIEDTNLRKKDRDKATISANKVIHMSESTVADLNKEIYLLQNPE